jgi:hypothetical protein
MTNHFRYGDICNCSSIIYPLSLCVGRRRRDHTKVIFLTPSYRPKSTRAPARIPRSFDRHSVSLY